MGRYFWIIFLLLGVWQIIGSLAERATKKQQDQRVKDLAAQRRRQQMAAQRAAGPRQGGVRTTPVPSTRPADRASELAARRKAQLDELRRRRTQRTGQPTAAGPATLRPTQPSFRPPPAPPTAAPPSRPVPRPAPVSRRPASGQKPQQARPRQIPPQEVRRLAPLERDEGVHRLVPTKKVAEAKGPRLLSLPGLGEVPMDRALLRRMIVYREILDPPVALREHQVWER